MNRAAWPLAAQVALGGAFLGWGLTQSRCGEDECLRDLFLVTTGVVWTLMASATVLLAKRGLVMAAWGTALVWLPLGWIATFALWRLFPSLGY